ncbi:GAF domain-containing protein [Streptomyces antimicrobicus]|uniref:GAF domain-containing protein n=1 Tax=Streptomyces antimicrobicus TaxID=2883108 RepID=A0ABS8B573_9ACTN|nr:GAF domain-containing protein [Streptomyces antimicrobicus]MCB5179764.1 GAF domain-containing protein [Streptomyces antimicrobicus]
MTYYESTGHLLLTPVDREAPARVLRLRELGLGDRVDADLDAFARRVARTLGAPYAGVNFIDEERQFFAGLHHAPDAPPSGYPARVLARDHGYCPHVVVRRRALVLEDVRDFARFAGNAVVDESGVRSYLGAPLVDRQGVVLGTVCAVDVTPRRWGTEGLGTIKSLAADLVADFHAREDALRAG